MPGGYPWFILLDWPEGVTLEDLIRELLDAAQHYAIESEKYRELAQKDPGPYSPYESLARQSGWLARRYADLAGRALREGWPPKGVFLCVRCATLGKADPEEGRCGACSPIDCCSGLGGSIRPVKCAL